MIDPLDALRRPLEPIEPRPEFTSDLLTHVRTRLRPDRVDTRSTEEERTAMTMTTAYEALDDALDVLSSTGPEFDPFGTGFCLSNHAEMAAEALCALGRPDAVRPRIDRYRKYLSDMPAPGQPITDADWREAVGDLTRVGDWMDLFQDELADDSWTDVVNRWVPRLAPGSIAVHGLLRAAHAVRAIGESETDMRRRDLAKALAYWAACYETLPESPGKSAGLMPSEALLRVEQLPFHDRSTWMLFIEPIAKLRALPSFAGVTSLVDVHGDPSEFLSDLTQAVAALLVSNVATVGPRAITHAFTAGSATRLMLPYLSHEATVQSLRYGWQVAAAFYAALVLEPAAEAVEPPDESIEDLVDAAVACGDEHGIKITEACLREYRINPNPVYLIAARETTRRLVDTGIHHYLPANDRPSSKRASF